MKEFKKLLGRLEEISISRTSDGIISGCNMGICEDDDCLKCLKKKIISIVNELAEEYKPKTQADRIRTMSDEELAQFLLRVNTAYSEPCMLSGGDCKWEDYPTHDKGCKDCFMEYLQSKIE